MIPKRDQRAQYRSQIIRARSGDLFTAIQRVSDLIDVPSDGTDFRNTALQRSEFLSGQRRQSPQMRPDQQRHISRSWHLSALGSLSQQQQVIGAQAHRYLTGHGHRFDGIQVIGRHRVHRG
jgi:hypothetical protein